MKNDQVAYLLLGSNIGNRLYYLKQTIELLSKEVEITNQSSIYETAAWGNRNQQSFLNMVVEISIDISPSELLHFTNGIESYLGRKVKGKYEPRTIDIDILFIGDEVVDSDNLTIPHPKLQYRRFVLVPLKEICPDFVHPILNKNMKLLLDSCSDLLPVEIFEQPKD